MLFKIFYLSLDNLFTLELQILEYYVNFLMSKAYLTPICVVVTKVV